MMELNPEQKIFRPTPERPANLESAYEKANLVAERHALQLESFIHEDGSGSNREVIKSDLRYVESRKNRFENLNTPEYKLAKALESAIYERVNNDRWFGERANMVMPSEYDDLANGIDGIVEFHEGEGAKTYLGLAIDVTYNQDPVKKFMIIKEQIDQGRMGTVKYFRPTDNTFEGRLTNVPRAVVALNAADATRVVRDWDEGLPDQGGDFRGLILRQMEVQLTTYKLYAESLERQNEKRPKISQYFEGARRNASALLSDIVRSEDLERIDAHPTMKIIRQHLAHFSA